MNGPPNIAPHTAPQAANDWKRPRATPSALIRRGIFALVAVASVAALAVAALPYVASTQIVRNRIAIELSAWSGFRVAIASTPQLEMWPTFKAVLSGVTLYQWGDWDNPAIIEAERVEIDLSALEALNGNVSFAQVKLVNPVMRLGGGKNEPGPEQITSGGRIAQAIESVRDLVASSPDDPPLDRFPTTALAGLTIQNGRVARIADGKDADIVTRLNGGVTWPALNAAGKASFTGMWRGEQVQLDLSSDSPLALFAGGAATIGGNWQSELAQGAVNGRLRASGDGAIQAHVEAQLPQLRKALNWTGIGLAVGSALDSFKLSGDLAGDWRKLALANAQVEVNGQAGAGELGAALGGERPALSGRLAFAALDLEPFVSIFQPIWSYDGPRGDSRPASDRIDAQLAVTAAKAKLGDAELDDLAGAVSITPDAARFELAQAAAFGGRMRGALQFSGGDGLPTTRIEATATAVNGKRLADAIDFGGLAPDASGDMSADVTGSGHALDRFLLSGNGKVEAHFRAGKIDGLDLAGLVSKTATNGFFPASEVAKGALDIDEANLAATIENGVGRLGKTVVRSGRRTISLSGILPYAGRGVALSGAVTSMDKISLLNPFGREATFFVGGSWDAPFVSAALPSQLPQQLLPE